MSARIDGGGVTVGTLEPARLRALLARDGLRMDLGAMRVKVRSPFADLAGALRIVYAALPLPSSPGFDDVTVDVVPSPGIKGRLRPSLRFLADGLDPFGAQDRAFTLPALEWGMNWCFAMQFNRHLLLHSGTVDIDGRGLMLVGVPGAGKSTLTAALAMAGHRALSDEFGVLRLEDLKLLALPKPIALKNRSIQVARERWPEAPIGPVFHKTHKGDVAHLAMPARSIALRHVPVSPSVVVLPRWREDAPLSVSEVPPTEAFMQLASNSFNADVLGALAFDAIRALVDRCPCFAIEYGNLDEVIGAIEAVCRDAG
jgi:HprK-related kinase A